MLVMASFSVWSGDSWNAMWKRGCYCHDYVHLFKPATVLLFMLSGWYSVLKNESHALKITFKVISLHVLLYSKLGCSRRVYIWSHVHLHSTPEYRKQQEKKMTWNSMIYFKRIVFPFCRYWLQRKHRKLPKEEYVAGDWEVGKEIRWMGKCAYCHKFLYDFLMQLIFSKIVSKQFLTL